MCSDITIFPVILGGLIASFMIGFGYKKKDYYKITLGIMLLCIFVYLYRKMAIWWNNVTYQKRYGTLLLLTYFFKRVSHFFIVFTTSSHEKFSQSLLFDVLLST